MHGRSAARTVAARDAEAAGGESAAIRKSRSEGVLRRVHEEGRVSYGTLDLPFEVFARRVLEVVARPTGPSLEQWPEELAARLERSGGGDLYLAIACEVGIPGAWEVFQQDYVPALRSLARRHGARGSEIEEAASGILSELCSPATKGPARTQMGTYSGAGSLLGWLSAILKNRIIDERRGRDRRQRTGEAWRERRDTERPGGTAHPSQEFDPSLHVVDAETCRRFGEAFRKGVRLLTPRERDALAFCFRDGKPQVEAARLLGVGEPRVSRLLKSGIDRIRGVVADAFPGERWEDLDRMWFALRRELETGMEPPPA